MPPTALPPDADTVEPTGPPGFWADRIAPIMFWLAFVYLLAIAGVVHRADIVIWTGQAAPSAGETTSSITKLELRLLFLTVMALWPIFAIEAIAGLMIRDRSLPRWPAVVRALLVIVFPPARMGLVHPMNRMIWLPRIGWQPPGKQLLARLDRATGGVMLVFAASILPLLAIQFTAAEAVERSKLLKLAVDVATAAIWVAFAAEFVIKSSAAPSFFRYATARWIDVAIVVLPTLEFVLSEWTWAAPALRLLRLKQATSLSKLAQMGKQYRLWGVVMKAWHSLVVVEFVSRLLGITPEKRLAGIEAKIAELEEQIAELRAEADELRKKVLREQTTEPT